MSINNTFSEYISQKHNQRSLNAISDLLLIIGEWRLLRLSSACCLVSEQEHMQIHQKQWKMKRN